MLLEPRSKWTRFSVSDDSANALTPPAVTATPCSDRWVTFAKGSHWARRLVPGSWKKLPLRSSAVTALRCLDSRSALSSLGSSLLSVIASAATFASAGDAAMAFMRSSRPAEGMKRISKWKRPAGLFATAASSDSRESWVGSFSGLRGG